MRFLLTMVTIGLTIWAAGFVLYVRAIPTETPDTQADVIVVLTGGTNRIRTGFDLLAKGSADTMLISGVGRDATVQRMHKRYAPEMLLSADAIALDPVARNTQQNARETKRFLETTPHKHVLLVTANYHMYRSLLEMRHAMPDIRFTPYPVAPKEFYLDRWWEDATTRYLMLAEYHKIMLVTLRHIFRG